MKRIWHWFLASAAVFFAASALAQPAEPGDGPRFSQAELDSMLAPIALYPDSMLSQLLMAATFPRDVSEAAAWSRANPQMSGEEAVRAVANEPWDPSVKSLVAFPQVLAMMDEHLEWTERLGDAFMANPTQVSETIQVLRGRADQAGNLRSGEEVVVRRDYGNYVIEPAMPEVVHVPYYDPRVVYGQWWWPHYEPMWWSPWVGYSWTPGYAFAWGYGVHVGGGFWYSSFDWPRRYVRFHSHRPYYYRGHSRWHGHRWYSDRDHRRNTRNWHWSGYNREGGQRRDGVDRGTWRRDARDGDRREWREGDRRDSRGGRDSRGREGDRRADERSPQPGQAVSPSYRGFDRTQERRAVAPVEQPSSRGAIPTAPVAQPGERSMPRGGYAPAPVAQPSQPLSRGAIAPPTAHVPSAQPVQRAPVAQPSERAPSAPPAVQPARQPAARERSEPRESPRSEPRESAPEPRSGGGNPMGRGGGRAGSNKD